MKITYIKMSLIALAIMFAPLAPAFGHAGETHETEIEETTHDELMESQMRTMIMLLEQIIALLQTKRDLMYPPRPVVVPVAVPVADSAMDEAEHEAMMEDESHDHDAMMDEHGDETPTAPRLMIEVEEHNSRTHVHVRYIDKPEAMFFVGAALADQASLVEDIAQVTGLSYADVRGALVYLGM